MKTDADNKISVYTIYFTLSKNTNSVQGFKGFVQNNHNDGSQVPQINLDEIARFKEILLRQQQNLHDKERRLATREREIKEKEQELTEKTLKTLEEWNKLLDCKEQSQQKNFDKAPQKWQIEQQSQELIDKNEAIKKMKQENIQMKEDIIKTLRKIDQQTEKNVIFDYIVPFLPSVISIIGFFMTNRNINNIQELSPVQEEIGNIMKKLNDTDRKILSTKLDESLKTFAVKPVTGK